VRVGVETGDRRSASVYTYADVPDFRDQELSLSGIVIGAVPSPRVSSPKALADLMPLVPTTRRSFARSDHVGAFLRIYQARPVFVPTRVVTRITNGDDTLVSQKEATIGGGRGRVSSSEYGAEVPVKTLPAGEYLLTIEATAGKNTERRDVRFSVE
jgi:hypothetical protein